MFWPRINQDIANMVASCSSCLTHQDPQAAEPMMSHDTPNRPWEKDASDLFEYNTLSCGGWLFLKFPKSDGTETDHKSGSDQRSEIHIFKTWSTFCVCIW